MEILVGIIFFISFPVFYIIGLITFVRSLFQDKNKAAVPIKTLAENKILHKLYDIAGQHPQMTVGEFVSQFGQPHHSAPVQYSANLTTQSPSLDPDAPSQPDQQTYQSSAYLSNWYSENTISILLFIGAFLIVMAVGIFVSFQWYLMTDTFKIAVVTGFNLLWYLAGWIFYHRPKVRLASLTFLTIGSVLVVVTTWSWIYFAFKPEHISPGYIWLVSAIFSLLANGLLALKTRRNWFTYFAGFNLVIGLLALVDIFSLAPEYNILACLVGAVALLFAGLKINKQLRYLDLALIETSHVCLIFGLTGGLILISLGQADLLSWQVSLGLLVTTLYSLLWYAYKHLPAALSLTMLAATACITTYLGSWGLSTNALLYVASLLSVAWFGLPEFAFKTQPQLQKIAAATAMSIALFAYVCMFSYQSGTLPLLIASIILSLELGLSTAYFHQPSYPYLLVNAWILSFLHLLWWLETPIKYIFIGICLLSYGIYLLAQGLPSHYKLILRNLAIIWALGASFLAWMYNFSELLPLNYTNSFPYLGSGLLTLGLLALIQAYEKHRLGWYVVSFYGLLFYLWNLQILGIQETQYFTLPLGLWILIFSYLENKLENESSKIYDVVGLCCILVPTLFQSNELVYSLLLAFYGLVALTMGITLHRQVYKAGGAAALMAAVVVQTSDYILALPRWLLVGAVGLAFLSLAVYLLTNRKEDKSN